MLNRKATIFFLIVVLPKKILLYKMSHFLQPHTCSKSKMKIKLDLSNYGTKSDLKTQQALIHQILLKKSDLASLKSDYDELNIDKLKNQQSGLDSFKSKADKIETDTFKPVPNDLSKLIDSVKNEVVEKRMYGE